MTLQGLSAILGRLLFECDAVYGGGRGPRDIAILCELYARLIWPALGGGEDLDVVRLAFEAHLRESPWFPRPCDILERLDSARRQARPRHCLPPMKPQSSTRTPGLAGMVYRGWRGNPEALRYLGSMGFAAARRQLAELAGGAGPNGGLAGKTLAGLAMRGGDDA